MFRQILLIQIRFNDLDLMGHVNNSVYFNYFDLGRVAYFDEVFGDDMEYRKNGVVIAGTNTNFFHQINLKDQIEVATKVVKIGNKSFDMYQQIRGINDGEVKCESYTTMVCFDFVNDCSMPMPEQWRKDIRAFEQVDL